MNPFELLPPELKRWIWKQNWSDLRPLQKKSIQELQEGSHAIISASTAAGKTEAALLPVLSHVCKNKKEGSFNIIYIAPLKALINDQYRRIESMVEFMDLEVTKWHGDASQAKKTRALKNPNGVLLITPESLEGLLIRHGNKLERHFSNLSAVIIDEIHAFIPQDRGVQLRSLLNRLDNIVQRSIPRVGLSATLGDLSEAARFLHSKEHQDVKVITDTSAQKKLKLQVKVFHENLKVIFGKEEESEIPYQISRELFERTRGKSNLVFAGSKNKVEDYCSRLSEFCEALDVPSEYFTHHANVSRFEREDLERRLKTGNKPTTAVCTNTLELGIDIGDVYAVYNIGPCGSPSALRQRMGRSGRREGNDTIMMSYAPVKMPSVNDNIFDRLNIPFIQICAEYNLLLEGVYEPPNNEKLHLSTLVHQILAIIEQKKSISPLNLFKLISNTSPFDVLDVQTYKDVLKCLGSEENDLIEQMPDGDLIIGAKGEKLVHHYEFYAVFETDEEYTVLFNGRPIGTLPVTSPLAPNMSVLLAGKRWVICDIDPDKKTIRVLKSRKGSPPRFISEAPPRHKIVDEAIRKCFTNEPPRYLSNTAVSVYNEACESYRLLNLHEQQVVQYENTIVLFPWAGTQMLKGLCLIFNAADFSASEDGFAIEVDQADIISVCDFIKNIRKGDIPDLTEAIEASENKIQGKYDKYLNDTLLVKQMLSSLPTYDEYIEWAKSCTLPSYTGDLFG